MTDPTARPDELAHLHARLADQETRLAAQQARLARLERRPRRRLPRRLVPLALVALLLALVPLGLLAANPFTDLDPAQATGHNPNIDLIYTAGITKGCNPPENTQYCPKDLVTREQMASFLARTAGLGTNPPVVKALTAVNATNATNATNAATVGGYAPNGLLRVTDAFAFKNESQLIPGPANPGEIDFVQVAITAPGPGFVLVTGVIGLFTSATSGCPCRVEIRLIERTPGSTLESGGFAGMLPNNTVGGSGGYVTLANTLVFPVLVPGPRTYALAINRVSGTAAVGGEGTITALFVPFGATGAPPPPAP